MQLADGMSLVVPAAVGLAALIGGYVMASTHLLAIASGSNSFRALHGRIEQKDGPIPWPHSECPMYTDDFAWTTAMEN